MGVSVWLAQTAADSIWPQNIAGSLGIIGILSGWLTAVGLFLWRGGGKQRDYESQLATHAAELAELKQGDVDIRNDRVADKRVLLEMSLFMERVDKERAEMRGDIGEVRGEVSQLMQTIHENERQIRDELGKIREGQATINATISARLDVVDGLKEVGHEIVREMRETRQNRERKGVQ